MARLLDDGHQVELLDSGLYREGALDSATGGWRKADTRDLEGSVFLGVDAVVHLAKLSNDPLGELDERLTVDINHRGSVRLADLASRGRRAVPLLLLVQRVRRDRRRRCRRRRGRRDH